MSEKFELVASDLTQYIAEAWNVPGRNKGLRLRFENNFGVSIARGRGNYNGPDTFEIAVIQYVPGTNDWNFVGDVRGWQSVEEVRALIAETRAL